MIENRGRDAFVIVFRGGVELQPLIRSITSFVLINYPFS